MPKIPDPKIAVVMISLNEGHNLPKVLENIKDFASEIHLVDSYSVDNTIDIALQYGVKVVQRQFVNFGDQWNFAVSQLPISAAWTMKLDPDEIVTDELKQQIKYCIANDNCDSISMIRRLYFMKRPMSIRQPILRIWKTGKGRFTEVEVNEHPIVEGVNIQLTGEIEHHDSPDLEHWIDKQNKYTTLEAKMAYQNAAMAAKPKLFGTKFERRMWAKKNFRYIPFRFTLLFLFNFLCRGAWRAGKAGYIWACLRSEVMWLREVKRKEMEINGSIPKKRPSGQGKPDSRVEQFD